MSGSCRIHPSPSNRIACHKVESLGIRPRLAVDDEHLPVWLLDRLVEVQTAYLPTEPPLHGYDLADPVVLLERGDAPARPLPAFFLPCGTKDPLLDDTRRLAKALSALGVKNEMQLYPGEPHAFHAFVWRRNAKDQWRHTFRFLGETLTEQAPLRPESKSSSL